LRLGPEKSDWKEEWRGEFPSAGVWGDPKRNLRAGWVGSAMPDFLRGRGLRVKARNDMRMDYSPAGEGNESEALF